MAKYAQTNRRIYMSQGRIRQAHISSHRTACRRTELPYRRYMADDRRQTSPRYTCRTFRRRPTQHRTEAHCDPVSLNENRIHVYRFISSAGAAGSSSPTAEATARRSWFLPSRRSPFSVRCRANLHPDTAHPPMSKVCWAYIHQKTPRPVRPNVPR